ncbi:MAG: NUDIX domain-containing protein [Candidatus Magasanikbacteria bacterium]|nr:NUDIX domain-containing protein [Candidatus Magasanikbacteria bacterium]
MSRKDKINFRKIKEEMGIDIEILRPLKPMVIKRPDGSVVILIHFLAKRIGEIKTEPDILNWGWFPIDALPENCAPNIKQVLEEINL